MPGAKTGSSQNAHGAPAGRASRSAAAASSRGRWQTQQANEFLSMHSFDVKVMKPDDNCFYHGVQDGLRALNDSNASLDAAAQRRLVYNSCFTKEARRDVKEGRGQVVNGEAGREGGGGEGASLSKSSESESVSGSFPTVA